MSMGRKKTRTPTEARIGGDEREGETMDNNTYLIRESNDNSLDRRRIRREYSFDLMFWWSKMQDGGRERTSQRAPGD